MHCGQRQYSGSVCSARSSCFLSISRSGPVAGILGIPYSLMVGNINLLYRVAMWITNAGVRAAGIKIELSGLENVPTGRSCIFMSNHVSNLDPPVEVPLLPGRCSVLLKKELMSIPILGRAMRMGQFVPVERGSRRGGSQGQRGGCRRCFAVGAAYSCLPRRDAVAGWTAFYVQEGAVLSCAGDACADCADRNLRHADDDAQGKQCNQTWGGADAVASGD